MTAKRPDSKPIRASGLIPRGDTAHRFKTKFAASVSFQTACAGLLRHSRASENPNTNMPLTPPTAEFVIPAQARIQAFDFQKRLESVPQSNSRLHGGLASADGDMKRPYPIDYFFRRPLRSSGHYNQHTSNRYGIGHLPPSACAGLFRHSRAGGNPGIGFSETLRICRTVKLPPARQACFS